MDPPTSRRRRTRRFDRRCGRSEISSSPALRAVLSMVVSTSSSSSAPSRTKARSRRSATSMWRVSSVTSDRRSRKRRSPASSSAPRPPGALPTLIPVGWVPALPCGEAPLALLQKPLPQPLARLSQVEPLQDLLLQLGELPLGRGLLEPLQELVGERQRVVGDAAEVVRECPVEGVQVLLAVHAERPGHLVEAVQRPLVQPEPQRLRQRERFLGAHLHPAIAQLVEEGHEHE